MTVEELIQELEKHPPKMVVYSKAGDSRCGVYDAFDTEDILVKVDEDRLYVGGRDKE